MNFLTFLESFESLAVEPALERMSPLITAFQVKHPDFPFFRRTSAQIT
jgi:hypothetical protein